MKKRLTLLLAFVLGLSLCCPAWAVEEEDRTEAAGTLYALGLFQGTGTDGEGFPIFSLERVPTRAESVTMLVRLLGAEEEALEGSWTTPFTDVPAWAEGYVGYAYNKGLTTGSGGGRFDGDRPVGAAEYLSFVLRALGYSSEKDFDWDSPWTLSDKLKLTNGDYDQTTDRFTRGDLAWVSCQALEQKPKSGGNKALWQVLGLEDFHNRCRWVETLESCQQGKMVFSFAPKEPGTSGKKIYTRFEVEEATANGLPCKIEQYSTPKAVKDHCKEREEALGTVELTDAFALVYLSYSEPAALAAAERTETLNGVDYPVITFRLKAKGTLPDGTVVEELARLDYYLNGYGGRF